MTIKDNGTTTLDIVSNGTTSVTFDAPGDIALDAAGGDILFKDSGTTFGSATNTSGNLIIKSGTSTAMTFAAGTSATLNGLLFLPDGTAAAPALANTGDTNTGFFWSADTVVSFTANGVSQFTMADGVIAPVTHDDVSLGTNSLRWSDVYTADLHLKNDRGDWTIVEEADYLTVINNATGKKYKMLMEEIED